MDRVTPEMAKAYVEWEPPVAVELTMPRVLGLLRAAFYAGWKAREAPQDGASDAMAAAWPKNAICPECGKTISRHRIDDHLASVHNTR